MFYKKNTTHLKRHYKDTKDIALFLTEGPRTFRRNQRHCSPKLPPMGGHRISICAKPLNSSNNPENHVFCNKNDQTPPKTFQRHQRHCIVCNRGSKDIPKKPKTLLKDIHKHQIHRQTLYKYVLYIISR